MIEDIPFTFTRVIPNTFNTPTHIIGAQREQNQISGLSEPYRRPMQRPFPLFGLPRADNYLQGFLRTMENMIGSISRLQILMPL